jgi:serine/threonine protein kinase
MPTKTVGFKRKIIKSPKTPASEDSLPFLQIGIVSGIVYTLIAISVLLIRRKVTRKLMKKSESPTVTTDYSISVTNLQTVINSVMGISKHAEFLIESSSIAKYKKIASGGGGELFLARIMNSTLAEKVGDTVIQKIVFIQNQTTEDAFYQEVGIMIMLSSFPHFCKIIGYTEKPLSLVLKYYPDGSLFDWLRKNASDKTIKIKILKETAEALSIMHSHYLAHCDLKSQNVLIEVTHGIPCCYLTDFGITQILSDQIVAVRMFNIINLRGLSINFVAPEAFNAFRDKIYIGVDFKKYDMYSFACVTYEVLVKKFPWM